MKATFIQKGLNQDGQKSKCNHLSNAGCYGHWTWHNFKSQTTGLSENDSPLSNHPISSSSCNSSARLEMLAGLDFYQH